MREVDGEVRVVPASEVPFSDLQLVLTGAAGRCQCQRIRMGDRAWWHLPVEQRRAVLRSEAGCDDAGGAGPGSGIPRDAARTIGLVAHLYGEPAGWCAVDARPAFRRLAGSPVPWAGRTESKDDGTVWAIACLIVRSGFRHRGLTYPLVAAAVEHARAHGARAIEGYPMLTGGERVVWDELNVGPVGPSLAAGFTEVSRPTKRRVVMRLDLADE